MPKSIRVIDSHTGGEPTRIIIEGGPDLGTGPLSDRVQRFRADFDHIRKAVVTEPRGSDVLVGGLLVEPTSDQFDAGIIFFNNHDYLGMCGHGTIGLVATLKHLGHIQDGSYQIETPVGSVQVTTKGAQASVLNVPSFRLRQDVELDVPDLGRVVGDVAWGGNWFFLVKDPTPDLRLSNLDQLTDSTLKIRQALTDRGVTGLDNAWIDHIELFGPPHDSANDSRNFVLCPGGAYDRSPCGTGTSAKLACLADDGKLEPGQSWRQESIIGSVFTGSFELDPEARPGVMSILPTISGTAFVNSDSQLILNEDDPYCMGIPS